MLEVQQPNPYKQSGNVNASDENDIVNEAEYWGDCEEQLFIIHTIHTLTEIKTFFV